jgi:hypothetical protein
VETPNLIAVVLFGIFLVAYMMRRKARLDRER